MIGGRAFLGSFFFPERRLEILTAVVNTFDQHGIGSNDKRNGDPPLEPSRAQARQQIIASLSSQWKRYKAVAEGHDAGDVTIGPTLAGLACDVLVQAVDMALGSRG
jgi:hypothetical protein